MEPRQNLDATLLCSICQNLIEFVVLFQMDNQVLNTYAILAGVLANGI